MKFPLTLAPPYGRLSLFAGNLATCAEAGVELVRGVTVSGRALAGTRLATVVQSAAERIKQGDSVATALGAENAPWPPFFVPMIEAGEETGHLDASLRYLEHHCQLLAGPSRTLFRVWSIPLAILVAGTVVEFIAYLVRRSLGDAAWYLWRSLPFYVCLMAVAYIGFASPFKSLVDSLKLSLPLAGALERELAVNRFFCALSMLYAAGGRRVESMIRIAGRNVSNLAFRQEMLRVARRIERGAGVTDAFAVSARLQRDERNLIATGELAGTLEHSFAMISEAAGEQLEGRLQLVQQFSVRLTMLAVILSIILTMRSLM